jgi:hypothetical protein
MSTGLRLGWYLFITVRSARENIKHCNNDRDTENSNHDQRLNSGMAEGFVVLHNAAMMPQIVANCDEDGIVGRLSDMRADC